MCPARRTLAKGIVAQLSRACKEKPGFPAFFQQLDAFASHCGAQWMCYDGMGVEVVLKIGDFSKLVRVSVRMLRYYDEAGLFSPAYIDPATGYRQYALEQIPLLNKIIFLRDAGFSVHEIAAAIREGEGALAARFAAKRREIQASIHLEQQRMDRLLRAIQDIGRDAMRMHYDVAIKSVPAYRVLSLRETLPDYFAEGLLWQRMTEFVERSGIEPAGVSFALYHDRDYRETDVDVEVCAQVPQLGENRDGFTFRQAEAVELMAYTMVHGPFTRIAGAYASFAGFLERHGQYEMLWPNRQIVHIGPWNEEDPERYLTELQIPLRKSEIDG